MKLISIQLCNFRQFYGVTPEIILASGKRNTTIIHGNNGAGKTTLINAFTWVLYNQFTAAFASPNRLVNKRAITEVKLGASVECWVQVYFEHDSKKYQVKRRCFAYQNKENQTQYSEAQLLMMVAGDNGRWLPPLEQPDDIIEGILPRSLHQYFFFDGEHLDRIFRYGEKNKIPQDTKELIGVKVLDRAIEHLKKARKTLENELKTIGDPATKKLLKEQNNQEKAKDSLDQRQEKIEEELVEKERDKKGISKHLLELSGAKKLQNQRHKLEELEKSLRQKMVEANNQVKQQISRRGYTVLISEIIQDFKKIVENLRNKGQIPSGIKKQFVSQLLEAENCICGRELKPDTEFYQNVKNWMDKAGIAHVEENAIRMEAEVVNIENQELDFWQQADKYQQNMNQWRQELSQTENELDEIKTKLRQYPDEDIQKLQQNIDAIETSIKNLTLEKGANQQKIESINQELDKLSKKITQHKMKEDKQNLAKNRIQATQESIQRLIEVKARLEKQFRVSLEEKIQEIFASISFTPYFPRISENYELTLVENTSGIAIPVAASTGENQILSLSFIGGIIHRVREWSEYNTLMGPDSSTFPVVMDSPFGSLDEIYRRQVAKSLPILANQLIVLATKTQWRGEVASEIDFYLGKEYILVYNSPKSDSQWDSIELNGKIYPLVKQSPNQFEYTEIIEVQRER